MTSLTIRSRRVNSLSSATSDVEVTSDRSQVTSLSTDYSERPHCGTSAARPHRSRRQRETDERRQQIAEARKALATMFRGKAVGNGPEAA